MASPELGVGRSNRLRRAKSFKGIALSFMVYIDAEERSSEDPPEADFESSQRAGSESPRY